MQPKRVEWAMCVGNRMRFRVENVPDPVARPSCKPKPYDDAAEVAAYRQMCHDAANAAMPAERAHLELACEEQWRWIEMRRREEAQRAALRLDPRIGQAIVGRK
jgi:hypothetical protein